MKTKDKKELETKTIEELKALLTEAKKTLWQLVLDKVQYKLKNTRAIFLKRKDIAQILTAIRRKELKYENA